VATNIGELVWKITGDTRDIDKSLKSTDAKMSKFGKTVAAAFSVAAVVAFGKAAFEVGKRLVTLASNAEETANKFNVVFDGVSRASEAAAELAENYGLSTEASQDLLSSTADLLQGFGVTKDASLDLSERTQQLAVDLASFSNFAGGAEGASQALTSALLGEREAVKALGIAITDAELKRFAEEQGLVFEELDKAGKAVLTLDLAYQQSTNSIGDFARSQDSFANQLRIAKSGVEDLGASIGEDLLPTATEGITLFNTLIETINIARDAADEYQEAVDARAEGTATAAENLAVEIENLAGLRRSLSSATLISESYRQSILDSIAAQEAKIEGLKREVAEQGRLNAQQEQAAVLAEEAAVRDAAAADRAAEAATIRLAAQEELAANEAIVAALFEEQEALRRQALADRTNAQAEAALAALAAEEAITAEVKRQNLERLNAASSYTNSVGQLFGNLFQAVTAGDKEMTERQKRNALALFALQKAASLAQVGIDTAAAIVKALPNIPLAVLAGAIGATQAAVIAATPPPALQDGGIVPAQPGGRIVQVAEGGRDEAIVPLDDAGGFGTLRVVVNLNEQPIIDTVQSASNRRELIIDAGSIS
jgi:hypothetical protein